MKARTDNKCVLHHFNNVIQFICHIFPFKSLGMLKLLDERLIKLSALQFLLVSNTVRGRFVWSRLHWKSSSAK